MTPKPAMTPAQVVESIYDAFNRGDIPSILSRVAADADWHQPKTLPWGGDYKGPAGAAEFFSKLGAEMETLAFRAKENVTAGDEVFSFGYYEARSRKTSKSAGAEWMFRWRVRDGKVISWNSYIDTAALVAAVS